MQTASKRKKVVYYNTNQLSLDQLLKADKKAKGQQQVVLEFFKKNPNKSYTPFQVKDMCGVDVLVPVTSIRRCMSNLTKDGKLVKNADKETMVDGEYNTKNHTWTLAKK